MATWPDSLGVPQLSGYGLETEDVTVRTSMESGPARVRRRYTAGPDAIQLKFIFDAAQMATFRAFWDADWAQGSAWVDLPVSDGRSSGLVIKPARPNPAKFKATPLGALKWAIDFSVEVRDA